MIGRGSESKRTAVATTSWFSLAAASVSELSDVFAAGQGLQGDDIDGAAQLGPAAAELPGLDAEELADPGPPLVSQGLAVDQDECGDLVCGNDRAGHHGLPGPGRRDQHP